jgi:hypothetical protein
MKEFKTVIAPKGCKSWLTSGKEYEAFNIFISGSIYGFCVIDDNGSKLGCVSKKDYYLNGQDWIIKEEPETNNVDEEIKLLEQLMDKFFAKISTQIVNDTIHIDYVHEAIAEFIEEEIINKQEIKNL